MRIETGMCMSADGYLTTPAVWPARLADPAFVLGASYLPAPRRSTGSARSCSRCCRADRCA
jgi:hypothetical protein